MSLARGRPFGGRWVVAKGYLRDLDRGRLGARLEAPVGLCTLSGSWRYRGGHHLKPTLRARLVAGAVGRQDLVGGVCPAVAVGWDVGAVFERPCGWDDPVAGAVGEDRPGVC